MEEASASLGGSEGGGTTAKEGRREGVGIGLWPITRKGKKGGIEEDPFARSFV